MKTVAKIMLMLMAAFITIWSFIEIIVIIDKNMGVATLIFTISISIIFIGTLISLICFLEKSQNQKINPVIQQRIKDLRLKRNIAPEEVAKMLGIKQKKYLQYEKGKLAIGIDLLIELASFYNVSVDDIVRTKTKAVKTSVRTVSATVKDGSSANS